MCCSTVSKRFAELFRIGRYSERFVLVTGCDTGFGNLLAKTLDEIGLNVFACCLTKSAAETLQATCSNRLVALQMDVTNEESIQKCLEVVKERCGDIGLWGLVNNAGVSIGTVPLELLQMSQVEKTMNVNIYGMVRVTKALLPLLRKSRGRIVNIASCFGRVALGSIPYCMSKFAVEGFSDRLRIELYTTGVTVHVLEPGGFSTNVFNNEVIERERALQQAEKDVKKAYGWYFESDKTKKRIRDRRLSTNLSMVVDAYTHALISKFPKHRYIVGGDSFFLIRILRNLPTSLADYIVMKGLKSLN